MIPILLFTWVYCFNSFSFSFTVIKFLFAFSVCLPVLAVLCWFWCIIGFGGVVVFAVSLISVVVLVAAGVYFGFSGCFGIVCLLFDWLLFVVCLLVSLVDIMICLLILFCICYMACCLVMLWVALYVLLLVGLVVILLVLGLGLACVSSVLIAVVLFYIELFVCVIALVILLCCSNYLCLDVWLFDYCGLAGLTFWTLVITVLYCLLLVHLGWLLCCRWWVIGLFGLLFACPCEVLFVCLLRFVDVLLACCLPQGWLVDAICLFSCFIVFICYCVISIWNLSFSYWRLLRCFLRFWLWVLR